MRKSPHEDFQFNLLHQGAEENFMKWFNGDDSVKMLCKWDDLGKGEHFIGGITSECIFESDEDQIGVHSKNCYGPHGSAL